jgi:hypothetical protein
MKFWIAIHFRLIIGAVLLTAIPACATTGAKADYHIEEIPSQHAFVSKVYVSETEEGIRIGGEIRNKQFPSRRNIPGHIDVEIISPDGARLTKNNIHYRMSRKAVRARFSIQLATVPVPGSVIRVLHHN